MKRKSKVGKNKQNSRGLEGTFDFFLAFFLSPEIKAVLKLNILRIFCFLGKVSKMPLQSAYRIIKGPQIDFLMQRLYYTYLIRHISLRWLKENSLEKKIK